MKKILCAAALLLAVGVTHASDGIDASLLPEKFISLVAVGKVEDAMNAVLRPEADGTIKNKTSKEMLATTKVALEKNVGPYRYREYVGTQMLGERLRKLYYLVGFEARPMVFVFEMYKPRDTWVVRSYKFTTDFDFYNGKVILTGK